MTPTSTPYKIPIGSKVIIKYCGHWSQMTPWMVGFKYPAGNVELLFGSYMGNWDKAKSDALELVDKVQRGEIGYTNNEPHQLHRRNLNHRPCNGECG